MSAYDGSIRINTKLNTKGFDSGISSIRATLGKFARVVGMAFSITALVKMGQEAIELASDIQEVDNVVSKSFGNMRSEMDVLADSAIKNLGMSRLTAYRTGSTFMAMGKSMLDSATDAKDMALALTKLTANMSSFYNISQDIASTALESIYTGETETLKQFGVVMTEVNLQQFAFEQGIQKKISAMTQAEKVMLRYKYVTEQLSFIGNDFIDTQDSWANQTRILKEQWKELLSVLGSGLITVLTPVVKTLNMVVSALINFANMVGQILSKLFGIKAQKFSMDGASDSFDGIADSADGAADATEKYGDAIEEAEKKAKEALLPFDDLNVLQQQTSSSGGSSDSGSGGGSGSGIVSEDIYPVENSLDIMDDRLSRLLQLLDPLRASLKKLWDEGFSLLADFSADTLKDFYHNFLVPVGLWTLSEEGLPRFFDITNELLKEISWDKLRRSLREFYSELSEFSILGFDSLLDFYDYFLQPLVTWGINKGLVTLLDVLTGFSKKVNWKQINTSFEMLYKVLCKFVIGIGNGLINFISETSDVLTPALAGLLNLLAKGLEFLCNILLEIPDEYIEALGGALGGLFAVIIAYKGADTTMKALSAGFELLCGKISAGLALIVAHPVVAIAAGLAALAGAMVSLEESAREQGELAVFGDTVANMVSKTENTCEEIRRNIDEVDAYVTNAGLAETMMAEDLAERYYELSEKAKLSNEEKLEMSNLSERLVELIPELSSYIDEETGLLDIQKNTMDALIQKTQEYYMVQAAEEKLKDLYSMKVDALLAVEEAQNNLKNATDAYNKAMEDMAAFDVDNPNFERIKELEEMGISYNDLQKEAKGAGTSISEFKTVLEEAESSLDLVNEKIGSMNEFVGKNQAAVDSLDYTTMTLNAANAIDELHGIWGEDGKQVLGEDAVAIYEEIQKGLDPDENGLYTLGSGMVVHFGDGFKDEMSNFQSTLSQGDLLKLEDMIPDGYKIGQEAGGDYALGLEEGVSKETGKVKNSVNGMADAAIEALRIGLDWHSPSKVSEKAGADYVLGFSNGIEDNMNTAEKALKSWLDVMQRLWDNYLCKWYKVSVQPYFEKGRWESLGQNMKEGLKAGFSGVLEDMKKIIDEMVKNCETAIKNATKQLESLKKLSSTANAVKNAPQASCYSGLSVPHLATGAIIPPNSKFLAMLGDQTSGYNIEAPASLIKDMVLQGIQESGGMGGVIELTVNLSGKQIHKEVVAVDKVFKTSTGHSAFEHK